MSLASVALGTALDRLGVLRLAVAARRKGLLPPAGLTVITHHSVTNPNTAELTDTISATPEEFDAQMDYLRRTFTPVSLEDIFEARAGGRKLPPDGVLVTFDDGYADNFEHALPILRRHGIRALFFVTTGCLTDRQLFWWERVNLLVRRSEERALRIEYPFAEEIDLSTPAAKAAAKKGLNRIIKTHYDLDLERFLDGVATGCRVPWSDAQGRALGNRILMTWDQVKSLRKAGMSIGSHSHAHRVLKTLPPAALRADLKLARSLLEGHLDEPVRTIAYPVGNSIAAEPLIRQAVVDAGYEMGFTTDAGINTLAPGEDPLDLRRLMADRELSTGVARLWMTFPFLAVRATRRSTAE